MKPMTLVAGSLVAMFWIAAIPSFAQRGRPAGVPGGAGSPGAPRFEPSPRSGSPNIGSNAGSRTPDQLLTQNTKLSENLASLLPSGVTAQQACRNFKNLGQCVAAIHVAHNLGLDFNSLACDMTLKPVGSGTCTAAPSKAMSLGGSIKALKPSVNSKAESKKAGKQAKQDFKESNS